MYTGAFIVRPGSSLGLLLGAEAPMIMPNGVEVLSPFLYVPAAV